MHNNGLIGALPIELLNLPLLTNLTFHYNNFGVESCPIVQSLIDRGNWAALIHSPQNGHPDVAFTYMEDCIPPCLPPVAAHDFAAATICDTVFVNLLGNDTGTGLHITALDTLNTYGAVVLTGSGIRYIAPAGYHGLDSLGYTVTDSCGQSASAMVTLNVQQPALCLLPSVETSSGNIYINFMNPVNPTVVDGRVQVYAATNGAAGFGPYLRKVNDCGGYELVWAVEVSPTQAQIMRSVSADFGYHWSAPQILVGAGPSTGSGFSAARNVSPSLSADGQSLAFVSNAGGEYKLYTLNLAGPGAIPTQIILNGVSCAVIEATYATTVTGQQVILIRTECNPGGILIYNPNNPGGIYPLVNQGLEPPTLKNATSLFAQGSTVLWSQGTQLFAGLNLREAGTVYAVDGQAACQAPTGYIVTEPYTDTCGRRYAVLQRISDGQTLILAASDGSCAPVDDLDGDTFNGDPHIRLSLLPALVRLTLNAGADWLTKLIIFNSSSGSAVLTNIAVQANQSGVIVTPASFAMLLPGQYDSLFVRINTTGWRGGLHVFNVIGTDAHGYRDTTRFEVTLPCTPPVWAVNPNAYPDWLTIFGRLTNSAGQPLDHDVQIAAYLNDELRGTARVNHAAGYFTLLVYGRNNERKKPVVFDVFDSTTCEVKHLCDYVQFDPDGMIGSTFNPYPLAVTDGAYQRKILSAGVNYITFYVDLSSLTLDQALAGLNGEGRHIQNMNNPSQAASFNPSQQHWSGSLQHIACGVPYKLTMSNPLPNPPVLCLSGTMCPPVPPVGPVAGWNRVGTMNNEPVAVEVQFAELMQAQFNLAQIKTEKRFTVYYDSLGVFAGSLHEIPSGGAFKLFLSTTGGARAASPMGDGAEVDPARYEDFMTLIATLTDKDGAAVSGELLARVGGELRGMATVTDGLYILGIYGNAGDGRVDLFARDVQTGREIPLMTKITFAPDVFVGEMFAPYPLVYEGALGTDDPEADGGREFKLLGNWPNPFNPATTIAYQLPEKAAVRLNIYDVSGRLIKALVNESVEAGRHEVEWDGTDTNGQTAGSGVYFYRLEAGSFSDVKRGVMLK